MVLKCDRIVINLSARNLYSVLLLPSWPLSVSKCQMFWGLSMYQTTLLCDVRSTLLHLGKIYEQQSRNLTHRSVLGFI